MKAEIAHPTIKTKWLVALSMLAGLGLKEVEVSKWYLAIVKTCEAIAGAIHSTLQLLISIGGSMTGFEIVIGFCSLLMAVGVIWIGMRFFR